MDGTGRPAGLQYPQRSAKWEVGFRQCLDPASLHLAGGTSAQGTSSTPAFGHHTSQGHPHPYHHRQQCSGGSTGGCPNLPSAAASTPVKIRQYNHHRQYEEDCDGGGGGPYLPSAAAGCGTPTQSRASGRGSWSVYRPPAAASGIATQPAEEGDGGGTGAITNGLLPRIKLRKVCFISCAWALSVA